MQGQHRYSVENRFAHTAVVGSTVASVVILGLLLATNISSASTSPSQWSGPHASATNHVLQVSASGAASLTSPQGVTEWIPNDLANACDFAYQPLIDGPTQSQVKVQGKGLTRSNCIAMRARASSATTAVAGVHLHAVKIDGIRVQIPSAWTFSRVSSGGSTFEDRWATKAAPQGNITISFSACASCILGDPGAGIAPMRQSETVLVNTTGVTKVSRTIISVYPNPESAKVSVLTYGGTEGIAKIIANSVQFTFGWHIPIRSWSCPSTQEVFLAWEHFPGVNAASPGMVRGFQSSFCWKYWVFGIPKGNGNGLFVFSQLGHLHGLSAAEDTLFNRVCEVYMPVSIQKAVGCVTIYNS